jgi:ABC-type anion transport system duplicated permease subunit
MVAVAGVIALAVSVAVEVAGAGEEAFSADETNMRCIAGSILAMTASMISSVEARFSPSAESSKPFRLQAATQKRVEPNAFAKRSCALRVVKILFDAIPSYGISI